MNEADSRPAEKVCNVSDCNAWKEGDFQYCHHHKGLEKGPQSDNGAPEGNKNAMSHGLRSDPVELLEHLRKTDEKAYAWVQDKYESYLQVAPFSRDTAHADQLLQICVREYSIWKASQIQVNDGILTKEKKVAGEAVLQVDVENPASKSLDRMERTVVKRLEKLGVMPSPDQQAAEATATVVELLKDD